jgi:hypothetical protein
MAAAAAAEKGKSRCPAFLSETHFGRQHFVHAEQQQKKRDKKENGTHLL